MCLLMFYFGILHLLFLFFLRFIYLRESKLWGGAEKRRRREKISGRLHAQHGTWCGTSSQDTEMMTWAETESQRLQGLSQVPHKYISKWDWFLDFFCLFWGIIFWSYSFFFFVVFKIFISSMANFKVCVFLQNHKTVWFYFYCILLFLPLSPSNPGFVSGGRWRQ